MDRRDFLKMLGAVPVVGLIPFTGLTQKAKTFVGWDRGNNDKTVATLIYKLGDRVRIEDHYQLDEFVITEITVGFGSNFYPFTIKAQGINQLAKIEWNPNTLEISDKPILLSTLEVRNDHRSYFHSNGDSYYG